MKDITQIGKWAVPTSNSVPLLTRPCCWMGQNIYSVGLSRNWFGAGLIELLQEIPDPRPRLTYPCRPPPLYTHITCTACSDITYWVAAMISANQSPHSPRLFIYFAATPVSGSFDSPSDSRCSNTHGHSCNLLKKLPYAYKILPNLSQFGWVLK